MQNAFAQHLAKHELRLEAQQVDTLQINLGKVCNQACKHCHVDAGPNRKEMMSQETAVEVVNVLTKWAIPHLDITGGAPELNPSFRYLVTSAVSLGVKVTVRHNLTVMFEPGFESLPEFFARNQVEIVSSLPYFIAEQTDAQRGSGVFERSLKALKRLNEVGYGQADNEHLALHLVYNPVGAFLPPAQAAIEADFKREMFNRYGIVFNRLYVITNMPINRFLGYLRRSGNEARYRHRLVEAFNPNTVQYLMCRNLISVGWDGRLYDCDFNQMLDIPLNDPAITSLKHFNAERLKRREIATGDHCFGCTAGSGSSCGGTLTDNNK
jgi:radical SAM/Cys-rich protein